MLAKWQVSIDTGGTFTDCIAVSPQGHTRLLKVLSSGSLGARLVAVSGSSQLTLALRIPVIAGLFNGYTLALPQLGWQSRITDHDENGHFELQDEISAENIDKSAAVYLTAHEEAPLLALRLATLTPLDEPFPPVSLRLGTTRGTNALLEGKGARTALLVSKGFADLLAIGTQQRPDLFALNIQKPAPLPALVLEVDEAVDAQGRVIKEVDKGEIERHLQQIKQADCTAVAVALKNSYRNARHEELVANILEHDKGLHVSASARLFPAIKYLTRTETTVVNAYLAPVLNDYLQNIVRGLQQEDIRVMTSSGGLARLSHFHPKDSLLSGPAGGVVGAAAAARACGYEQVLTIDMGGTSTDVARYSGSYDYTSELRVGRAHLFSEALAIETVAAGGGSVCRLHDNRLEVGPQSAGARPGPACYGQGGPLTVTDLNLLSGRIDPQEFGFALDNEAAAKALEEIATQLSERDTDALINGFLHIANQKMADAIRKISILKGFDPKEYALLGFGGAIGQHICDIATLLNVSTIIMPYRGSLLSAAGIAAARIEHHLVHQLLQPLPQVDLPAICAELGEQAVAQLKAAGTEQARVVRTVLHLRLSGQDNTLEIPYDATTDPAVDFEKKYRSLFGHWANRPIEVESIRVTAAEIQSADNLPHEEETTVWQKITPAGQCEVLFEQRLPTPVYKWEEVAAYDGTLTGPAIIYNPFTSLVVNPGWQVHSAAGSLIIRKVEKRARPARQPALQEVALTLYANRFKSVAERMGTLLQRTALSVNIKERLDFSCALLDREGRLVVNAPHIPVHLGSLGICTRKVVATLPLGKGDVAITNHPAYGGSHLPDVTLIAPVFAGDQLLGYVANRAHHAEIGGKAPGSMPADATSLAEEGVVISPTLLMKGGQPQWATIENMLTSAPYPSRAVADNLTDFQAALASIIEGQKAMQELIAKFGSGQVIDYMQQLAGLASQNLTDSLHALNNDRWQATEYLDDGSRLQVAISWQNEVLDIDFSGTAATHPGNLNATEAIVNGAVIYVLKLLTDKEIPLNEGLMHNVRLHIPPGSLLNPHFDNNPQACPAVVGGNTEVSQRLVDTLLKAFGLAACSQGTMNNFLFGNERFGYYETIGGGSGAEPGFAGASGVHQHMTNTQITDAEVLEHRYPVRLLAFALRPGSGGAGHWPGGDGIVRQMRFLEPVTLTLLTQHRQQAPYGLAGGQPGKTGRQYLLHPDGSREELPGIGTWHLQAGTEVTICTPGGGGYGK